MMKKTLCFAVLLFLTLSHPAVVLSQEVGGEVESEGAATKVFKVMGRGVVNAVTFPLDILFVAVHEMKYNTKVWPLTYPFRLVFSIANRVTSVAYDFFFYPWVVPGMEKYPSLVERMGYPEYPWGWLEDDYS